jgi:hypothetical protein
MSEKLMDPRDQTRRVRELKEQQQAGSKPAAKPAKKKAKTISSSIFTSEWYKLHSDG